MCCLFGIMDYEHRLDNKSLAYITSVLSVECEARGTDATGIAYLADGNLSIYKRPVPARRLKIRLPRDCHVIMGHTRFTTQGNEKLNRNNHPFMGATSNTNFALAHNGVLHNDKRLRASEKLPSTSIQTDSYIAVQLIESRKSLDFESLKHMAEKVEGSFSFTVLDRKGNLYFIKGDSPLCIYKFTDFGFYLYASTEDILKKAIVRLGFQKFKHEEIMINGGDILMLDRKGRETRGSFEFDDYHKWGYCMNSYRRFFGCSAEDDYWKELRSVSNYFGYEPEDIDRLRRRGYSPDDVEDFLYCGESV